MPSFLRLKTRLRLETRFALAAGLLAVAEMAAGVAAAADYGIAPGPAPEDGVVCNADSIAFPSVWLGHFSGGRSFYDTTTGKIVLDWQDQKLCFPSKRSCNAWVRGLRREYHRPEGYWTCLVLR